MRDDPAHGWTRREAVGAVAATVLLPGCARVAPPPPAVAAPVNPERQAQALLDTIAENLLRLGPEGATSLGIDKGERAALKGRLSDRSLAGQERIAALLRADLAAAEAVDTAPLTHATRTSVEVVKRAYRTALDGFALPYGDVAVGGWRN